MSHYAIYVLLLEQFEEEQNERREMLRSLRDASDPFSMPDGTFEGFFRLSKDACQMLVTDLQPFDRQPTSLPFVVRFFTTLHFYATGSYQKSVGNNYMAPMSQASVSRTISYISVLIADCKENELDFPKTSARQLAIKAGFYSKFGIKGVIGAIDCTHIQMICPPKNNPAKPCSMFMNRKGTYSLNVEAVGDDQLQFLSFNARYPGSVHDSGIWTTSPVRVFMSRQRESWLLGDQGYPLEPWLLTPIANPVTATEKKYNTVHGKARNVVERLFGVFKSRFRCMSKLRTLHYSPETVAKIANACAVLHNIAMKTGAPPVEEEEADDDSNEYEAIAGTTARTEGLRVRQRVMEALP